MWDLLFRELLSLFSAYWRLPLVLLGRCHTKRLYSRLKTHGHIRMSHIYSKVITQGHRHNGDQAARRPHILWSICGHSFGALAKAVRLFKASLSSQPMCSQMCCSIDIFIDLQPFDCNLKGIFRPEWHLEGRWGVGICPFDSPPMGSHWLLIDTYGLSLTVFSYLDWLQTRFRPPFRPSDSDTMTIIAL